MQQKRGTTIFNRPLALPRFVRECFDEGHRYLQQAVITLLSTWVLPRLGVQIRVIGKLPSHGPYILAANHASHIDTPILYSLLDKKEQHRCRIAASHHYFFKRRTVQNILATTLFPLVPVGKTALALCHTTQNLKKSEAPLIIYPEGTRSRTGKCTTFRQGIGLIASKSGLPIVPVTIRGSWHTMPAGQLIPKPGVIEIIIHEEIADTQAIPPHRITRAVERAITGRAA